MDTNYHQIARQMVLKDLSAHKSSVGCFTVTIVLGIIVVVALIAFAYITL
jgi:hypothetical protein